MEISVSKVRAQFAAALAAAGRGESVSVTRNGRVVARIVPPPANTGWDWDAIRERARELGWDKLSADELWPPEFDDPTSSWRALGYDEHGNPPEDPLDHHR